MTKSFVDKRRPWQNRVSDRHVGNKLSFQVNWTLWINSIALSSSDHPSSIQNHWSIGSGFLLSPQLEETSKPQQNHWLIKQGLGRTEYLVGRRGTNQLCLLERYLDVLVKHTTEILPPTALVEDVSLRWFILSCEYLISLNQIHAHTCCQSHRGNGSQNLQRLSDFLQQRSDFPQRLSKILNSFLLSKKSKKIYLRREV